jgi:hypothetical protein
MEVSDLVNKVRPVLHIILDKKTKRISKKLLNLKSDSNAKILKIEWCEPLHYYNYDDENYENDDDDDIHVCTEEELNSVGYNGKIFNYENVEYTTENDFFTVKEIFDIILLREPEIRSKTNWFGGIDVHHIFYEGLHFSESLKTFKCAWGS